MSIDVHAAGVNFPDGLIVQGKYQTKPPRPFVPGSEFAGVVRAIGPGVTDFAPGDAVVAFTGTGAFAERAVAPAAQTYKLPPGIAPEVVAGLLVTHGTAYHALKDRAALQPGETLLVLGAAGGVGLAAVELGHAMGARVIAVASTADKRALAEAKGAQVQIGYDGLGDALMQATDGRGCDVVFDPVGSAASLTAIKALAWGGRHLIIGFAAGDIPSIPANRLLLKSAASIGVLWGADLRRNPDHHRANIETLLDWLQAGRIRPVIDARFPLERASEAIARVMTRHVRGKVILVMREEDAADAGSDATWEATGDATEDDAQA